MHYNEFLDAFNIARSYWNFCVNKSISESDGLSHFLVVYLELYDRNISVLLDEATGFISQINFS